MTRGRHDGGGPPQRGGPMAKTAIVSGRRAAAETPGATHTPPDVLAQRPDGRNRHRKRAAALRLKTPGGGDPPYPRWDCWLLAAEVLDLVELGLGQLAGDLALGHLGGLDLVADLLHDLGVGERGDVAGVGEV